MGPVAITLIIISIPTSGRFVAPMTNTKSWLFRLCRLSIWRSSWVRICCETPLSDSSFLRFLNTLSISSKNRMQGLVMTEIETNTPASNGSRKQIANSSFTLSDFLTDQFTDWWTNEIQVTQLWTSSRNSCLSSSWRSVKENPCRWRHSKMLILLEMRHE